MMNHTDPQTPRWHVLTVKKGCEKQVTRDLRALGFDTLMPFRRVIRQWSDRRKRLDEPLFRGYAFVCVSEARRSEVFAAGKNMAFLRHEGRPCLLRDAEVELLRHWSQGIDPPETDSYGQLRPGSLVEIVEGAFLGYRGIIRAVDNDNRLRLELLFTGSLSLATVEHTLVKLI